MKIYKKDKLEILQQRIPIVDRQGFILLQKTEENTDKTEKYFTEDRILIIVNKTETQSEIAPSSQKNNFDIKQTITTTLKHYFP